MTGEAATQTDLRRSVSSAVEAALSRKAEGRMNTLSDLKAAIHEGAVLRIRPKTMTVMTTMMGLLPIIIGTQTGSDVMKRLAAPMFGGLVTSFAMELLIDRMAKTPSNTEFLGSMADSSGPSLASAGGRRR